MPDFNRPAGQWLGQQLGAVKSTAAALSAQGTEYIVDSDGVCRAIIGHLVAEPNGAPTGLSGWGIAVKLAAGIWAAVGAPLHAEASGGIEFTTPNTVDAELVLPSGPEISIPTAGEYDVWGKAMIVNATVGTIMNISPTLTGPTLSNTGRLGAQSTVLEGHQVPLAFACRITLAAGDTLQIGLLCEAAKCTCHWYGASLYAQLVT